MSKTFVYDRFDMDMILNSAWKRVKRVPASDGSYVLAEDAINREAVLQAQIRTLETQLKDSNARQSLLRKQLYVTKIITGG